MIDIYMVVVCWQDYSTYECISYSISMSISM